MRLSRAEEAGKGLQRLGLTLSLAESCTGGLLSSIITASPGSSAYFHGAVVSYSNDVKIRTLGVSPETIENFGAVSAPAAEEMAEGVRKALFTTASLAITGIAGPGGGTTSKPLGRVFIALSFMEQNTIVSEFNFKGSRGEIREQSAAAALKILNKAIKETTVRG